MKFFMILLMLMLPSSGHAKCVCPKGWSVYGRHCYLYVSQPDFFYNAEAICLSKSINGRESHLASVLDDREADFIAELASVDKYSYFWIGLKGYYYSWQWTDGEPYTFSKWGTNYPYPYSTGENCVLFADVANHYWLNYPYCSTNMYPYVCKMLQRYQYRPPLVLH
ncbi:snaclec 3-like [Asterias amurensis]|uniref:snaclec 3-like n=1 Tax=Asterias amurensis TaxID=7602 RepID=UPI003AB26522